MFWLNSKAVFGWLRWCWSCNCSKEATVRCVLFRLSIQKLNAFSFFLVGFLAIWLDVWFLISSVFWWWVFLGSFFLFFFFSRMVLFCFWHSEFWIRAEAKLELFAFSFLFMEARFSVLSFLILFIMLMLPLSWCIESFQVIFYIIVFGIFFLFLIFSSLLFRGRYFQLFYESEKFLSFLFSWISNKLNISSSRYWWH